MLSADIIRQMRQTSISADADMMKERVHALWKSATLVQREIILAFTGLKKTAVSRAYTTGNIPINIVLAMAQTLDVNPLYLTGEAKERGECSNSSLNAFLTDKHHAHISEQEEWPSSKFEAADVAETAAPVTAERQLETPAPAAWGPASAESDTSIAMPKEDAVFLLRALFIRARYSTDAKHRLDTVKALLV